MSQTATDFDLAQIKQTYDRDGYVIVPGLYDNAEMLRWKQVIQKTLLDSDIDVADSGVHVWRVSNFPDGLLESMREKNVAAILKQIIGPSVEFLSAKAVFKNGVTKFPTPWHQDWYYWHGAPKLSVWIALDDATPANGCLKLIPGSYKKAMPNTLLQETKFANQIDDEHLKGMPVETIDCKRGDAVFFSDLAVHSSHPNTSGEDRWSFISTYRDAAAKDEANVWDQSLIVSGESVHENAVS